VEGGLFTEELVTRYPLIVIKCHSFRGTIAREVMPLKGPSSGLAIMESLVPCIGNFSGRSRRAGSQIPIPTSQGEGMGYLSLPSTNLCKGTKFVKTQYTI
jgi:hypothetical protein